MLRLLVASAHLPAATGAGPGVHVYARFRGTAGDKGTLRWLSLHFWVAAATFVSLSWDGVALSHLVGWDAVGCPRGMVTCATHISVPNPTPVPPGVPRSTRVVPAERSPAWNEVS